MKTVARIAIALAGMAGLVASAAAENCGPLLFYYLDKRKGFENLKTGGLRRHDFVYSLDTGRLMGVPYYCREAGRA